MRHGITYKGTTADGKKIRYVAKDLIAIMKAPGDDDSNKTKTEAHMSEKGNIVFRDVVYGDKEKAVVFTVFKTAKAAITAAKKLKGIGATDFLTALEEYASYEEV